VPEGALTRTAGEYETSTENAAISELEGPVAGAVHLFEDILNP
jgi:hypothetical protein